MDERTRRQEVPNNNLPQSRFASRLTPKSDGLLGSFYRRAPTNEVFQNATSVRLQVEADHPAVPEGGALGERSGLKDADEGNHQAGINGVRLD